MILANGIEHAICACQKNEREANKWIWIDVVPRRNGVTMRKLEDACQEEIFFGPDGLPKVRPSEKHGIGPKNSKAVVDHYGSVLSHERTGGGPA